MSRWGIAYKGAEVLTPEEWNRVVDALQELDGRAPLRIYSNIATFSGDGTTKDFGITHNWGEVPTAVFVTPASPDASGSFWVEVDATNLIVHYNTAPPSGTDNVKFFYILLKLYV